MSVLFIGLGFVLGIGLLVALFVAFEKSKAKKKKQLDERRLTEQAQGCSLGPISESDNLLLAIDTAGKQFFYLDRLADTEPVSVRLEAIESCSVVSEFTTSAGAKSGRSDQLPDRVCLVLKSKNRPDNAGVYTIPFYDARQHNIYLAADRTADAKNWQQRIASLLQQKAGVVG